MADARTEGARAALSATLPSVVTLDSRLAGDEAVAGAKAANLARCANASLRVLPGFVLTTEGARRGLDDAETIHAVRRQWESSGGSDTVFVVRSSSTIEDSGSSSMAGQFTSVLDVQSWAALVAAVAEVLRSGRVVLDESGEARPMAVLVQRQLEATTSGVLFGVDPVTGDRDHLAVDVVAGRPDALVGGEVTADHHVLTRRGAVVDSSPEASALSAELRGGLAHIAFQGLVNFQAAQDMEWAVDDHDTLWVLQSRPVTAVTPTNPGPLMGPGPVAETFPAPLTQLEADLWLTPLREGITQALRLTGAASEEVIRCSPVLRTYGGRAAVDLELLGVSQGRRSLMERFGPKALLRHLAVAWRVGRTRVALPTLGCALIVEVDDHLAHVPRLGDLELDELIDLLLATRTELSVVHAAEVLTGMLLAAKEPASSAPSAASVALAALSVGRAAGLDDEAIIAEYPVVLALSAPSTKTRLPLPDVADLPGVPGTTAGEAVGEADGAQGVDALDLREALRLRTRWLQELAGRTANELAARREVTAALRSVPDASHPGTADLDAKAPSIPELARHLHLQELSATAHGHAAPADLADRAGQAPGPPLPAAFRVTDGGRILAERRGSPDGGPGAGAGQPAGGGRVVGTTCHRVVSAESPLDGWVLVTDHLVPELAPLLPRLVGLISETGSPLSHLAILARETGVATVVGVPDARRRYPSGLRLLVDGLTGEVAVLDGGGDLAPAVAGAAPNSERPTP